jgi:hypothetical protein
MVLTSPRMPMFRGWRRADRTTADWGEEGFVMKVSRAFEPPRRMAV